MGNHQTSGGRLDEEFPISPAPEHKMLTHASEIKTRKVHDACLLGREQGHKIAYGFVNLAQGTPVCLFCCTAHPDLSTAGEGDGNPKCDCIRNCGFSPCGAPLTGISSTQKGLLLRKNTDCSKDFRAPKEYFSH